MIPLRMPLWIVFFTLGIIGIWGVAAMNVVTAPPVALSPEEVVDIRRVTDADLSPDGATVAFATTRWRGATEPPGPAWSEIWLVPTVGGGAAKRFTNGEKGDSQPRFSPDGKLIGFLSTRGSNDKTQVLVIPLDGGEARAVTASKTSIAAFAFSRNGSRIAFVAPDPVTDDEEKRHKAGDDEAWIDHDFKQRRLSIIDVAGGEAKVVSPADLTVWNFDGSPMGDCFAFVGTATPKVDDQYCFAKLYLLDVASGKATALVDPRGKLGAVKMSPDGSLVAFLASGAGGAEPYAGSLFVVSTAGGPARCLTDGYEGTCTNVQWSPKGDLYFTSIESEYSAIYWVDPKSGDRKSIARGIGALAPNGPLAFSRDSSTFTVLRSGPNHPPEAFIGETRSGVMRRLTTLNPSLESSVFGGEEVVSWFGANGLEIEGVLVKPVGYEEGHRYPMVVTVHGGPESAETLGLACSWGAWAQPLAQRGFAVLRPNYRGSIGRGVAFASADQKDLGGAEWQDILAGVDEMVKRGIADPDRLGIGGWSYGGYMTCWGVTQTPRFKAGVMGAGISNWVSMVGTSDITYENSVFHWASWAYDDFSKHFERSGLAHVKDVQTPLLILHGQADPRVPTSQGQEFYAALKVLNKPVEMVTYPREPHGIGERAHQIDVLTRALDWFDRYLKAPVPPTGVVPTSSNGGNR
ncbi:MAG: S9 family peptidase [Planctomycetes bacterium]|nr:S9 family peptidase [Planctomycetota bacterium]MBI3843823.1 S9 family peptidase [Planctomycetota bacterium]